MSDSRSATRDSMHRSFEECRVGILNALLAAVRRSMYVLVNLDQVR